jgi:glycine oxidase
MGKIHDFVIVGQGLAGTVLSVHLIANGYDLLVIDNGQENTSSKVAAGLYNPITGKRMVKSWMADELLAYSLPFYESFEKQFDVKILYPKPLYRIFSSIEEQNQWVANSSLATFNNQIEVSLNSKIDSDIIANDLGGIIVKNAGYLEVNLMLETWKKKLEIEGRYVKAEVDFSTFEPNETIKINGFETKYLIFCDGYKGKDNPFFSYLPFQFSKGEILEIQKKTWKVNL